MSGSPTLAGLSWVLGASSFLENTIPLWAWSFRSNGIRTPGSESVIRQLRGWVRALRIRLRMQGSRRVQASLLPPSKTILLRALLGVGQCQVKLVLLEC